MTYQHLIDMGFNEDLSMIAGGKFGKNIDAVISFIITTQQNTADDEKANDSDDSYNLRIKHILDLNQE